MSRMIAPIDKYTCDVCKADVGSSGPQKWLLKRLPHANCTCPNGCRCAVESDIVFKSRPEQLSPIAYLYQWVEGFGQGDVVSIEKWDDEAIGGGWKEIPLYTSKHLKAYINKLENAVSNSVDGDEFKRVLDMAIARNTRIGELNLEINRLRQLIKDRAAGMESTSS